MLRAPDSRPGRGRRVEGAFGSVRKAREELQVVLCWWHEAEGQAHTHVAVAVVARSSRVPEAGMRVSARPLRSISKKFRVAPAISRLIALHRLRRCLPINGSRRPPVKHAATPDMPPPACALRESRPGRDPHLCHGHRPRSSACFPARSRPGRQAA